MSATANDLPRAGRYRHFHPLEAVNFQINRWLADAQEEELIATTSRCASLIDLKREMLALAARAESVDAKIEGLVAANESNGWAIRHGTHISGSSTPSAYLDWLRKLRTAPFSSKITQDVLLTAGTDDHIVPLEQFFDQARTLTNARSVTMRLFTEYEGCASHCQNGNKALLLAFLRNWLEFQLSERDRWVASALSQPHLETAA